MFTKTAVSFIIFHMKSFAKHFSIVLSALLVTTCAFVFRQSGLGTAADGPANADVSEKYVLSSPVDVSARGSSIYVLLENGLTLSLNENGDVVSESFVSGVAGGQVAALENSFLVVGDCDDLASNGTVTYAVKGGTVSLTDGENLSPVPALAGYYATCVCSYGDLVYLIAERGGEYDLVCYDGTARTVEENLETDGTVTGVTCYKGNVYYSTEYSVFPLYAESRNVGGIISITSGDNSMYYVTKSGKICSFDGSVSKTLQRKTGAPVMDIRGTGKIVSYGDASVLAGEKYTADANVTSVALDYFGNPYYSTKNGIVRADNGNVITKGPVDKMIIDRRAVDDARFYYTRGGDLYDYSGALLESGVTDFDVTADGEIYLLSGGEVSKRGEGVLFDAPGALGLVSDAGGNVFTFTRTEVVKNGNETVHLGRDVAAVYLSRGTSGDYSFGDLVVIDRTKSSPVVVKSSACGSDMITDEAPFEAGETVMIENAVNLTNATDVRTSKYATFVYPTPAETPGVEAASFAENDYCIILGRAADTDYLFVFAECGGSSRTGYLNERLLSDPVQAVGMNSELKKARSKTLVYSLPTTSAPTVGELALGDLVRCLSYVPGYKDAEGREWTRVTNNTTVNGYVLSDAIRSSSFTPSVENDAVVSRNGLPVPVYVDAEKTEVIAELAGGTRVARIRTDKGMAEISFVTEGGTAAQGFVEEACLESYDSDLIARIVSVSAIVLAAILIVVFVIVIVYYRTKATL